MPRRQTFGGGAGGGRRGGSLEVTRSEPAFIRRIKEQVGYRESTPDLNAKLAQHQDDEDDEDREHADEKPTVVVVRKGDLTEEEAEREKERLRKETEDAPTSDGKILFKQPKKRSSDATEHERMKTAVPDKVKKTKVEKKQPSRSLLSFDDEEEDS